MSLGLSLDVEQPRVLYQQSCKFTLRLTNGGKRPVDILVPTKTRRLPLVRILDLKTGVEHECRHDDPPRTSAAPMPLQPSKSLTKSFSLGEYLPHAGPGKYEVTATWEWGDGESATSNVVEVEILPTTPRSASWVAQTPLRDDARYGVWVDVAGDHPQVVRSQLVLGAGGGASDSRALWPCARRAEPLLSCSFPDEPSSDHWVAWVDGGDMLYGYVDDADGPGKLRKLPLPRDDAALIAPLHHELPVAGEPPAGVALVVMGPPGGTEFGLQAIQLGRKPLPGGVAALRGPRPRQIWSHALSSKERWISMLQVAGAEVSLLVCPWPGLRRSEVQASTEASWTGELLGAGTQVLEDGRVGGAALLRTSGDDGLKLELVRWSLGPGGAVEPHETLALAWEWDREITQVLVALRNDGLPGALLRVKEGGQWWVWDGARDPTPLGGEWTRSDMPLELGFLGGYGEPLVLGGRVELGWGASMADGSPLPGRNK